LAPPSPLDHESYNASKTEKVLRAREILTTLGEKIGVETVLHAVAKKRGVPVKTVIDRAHKFARFFKHADRDPTDKIEFSEAEIDDE
jgi:hypothetical protein